MVTDRTRAQHRLSKFLLGIPDGVEFRTKPQLARRMLGRALDAKLPAASVTADEVYGADLAKSMVSVGAGTDAGQGGRHHPVAQGEPDWHRLTGCIAT
jgi:DDE superfamily endonuclease